MSEELPRETKGEFGARLARLVEEALGGDAFPNPEGWRFDGITLRATRGGDNRVEADVAPVLRFALPERALSIAVMERDLDKPAYFRTAHYDIAYTVESTEESQKIFDTDRDTIDRFCQWIVGWDGPEVPEAISADEAGGGG